MGESDKGEDMTNPDDLKDWMEAHCQEQCPWCGGLVRHILKEAQIHTANEQQVLPVFPVICEKCGYVALFAVKVVEPKSTLLAGLKKEKTS